MPSSALRFTSTANMFGTTITLSDRKGSFNEVLVENFNPTDPLKNMSTSVKKGYLFRSPNIRTSDWPSTFSSLSNCDGKFCLKAEMIEQNGNKTVTAWIRFAEKADAALFAWTNVEIWQKWSDELEADSRKKDDKETANIFVDEDGKIKAKVSVTTLGD